MSKLSNEMHRNAEELKKILAKYENLYYALEKFNKSLDKVKELKHDK